MAAAGVALVAGGLAAYYLQSPQAVSADPSGAAPTVTGSPSAEASVEPVREAVPAKRVSGMPTRVVIPALKVNAVVLPIKAPGGTLIPPSDPQELGWWAAGARPGAARGSALVTGHTVHTGGGALDDLETLHRGDRVRVKTSHGWIAYDVQRVHVYSKGSVADHAQRLFSQKVPGRLVLITCEDWDGSRYLSNAVVTAVPAV
nr:class F sortase [Nocardioides luti]